ncbi:hypothetical protein, partial [Bacillus dakarensis]|uniref:hypothetical protein n=1 Tax=Robertmurraya dakarensis TaxID=1926278 RepID=UPI003B019F3D
KPPFWFVDEESINEIQKLRKLDPEQAKQRYERIKSELYKALELKEPEQLTLEESDIKKRELFERLSKYN